MSVSVSGLIEQLPGDSRREKPTAFVVDDEQVTRRIVAAYLTRLGYRVIRFPGGRVALGAFDPEHVDLVVIDGMMPDLDGWETVRRMKEICGDEYFVPMLFLAGASDQDTLVRCLDAGGDDFLSKPVSRVVLQSKVNAMRRIRELHARTRRLLTRQAREEEIARQVFDVAVIAGNVERAALRTLVRPASAFSGDVLLTAVAPSGDLHVMIGDLTGHGLAAALGALPAAETFRAMTAKGFALLQVLEGIDHKLRRCLPGGMFMATAMVAVDRELRWIEICNCGLPEILVLDPQGRIARRVPSRCFAPGVSRMFSPADALVRISTEGGERVLVASDGLTEACNAAGEQFGTGRYERIVTENTDAPFVTDPLVRALDAFCGGIAPADDVTMVEIACRPELFPEEDGADDEQTAVPVARGGGYVLDMTLEGALLAQVNPVPLLHGRIKEFEGGSIPSAELFTVLTELYVNALDHGVLGLDSAMKDEPEGFMRYMRTRDERLAALGDGRVRLRVTREAHGEGDLVIRVEDSGHGFDPCALPGGPADAAALHGRGLLLVRDICEAVSFSGAGNCVEARFRRSRAAR